MISVSPTVSWPTSAKDLFFSKRLGRGYFGEVWQCKIVTPTGDPQVDARFYAVKKVPLATIQQHSLMDQMEREIRILQSLRHEHIVQLFFDFRDDTHVYLGMEYAEGGGMFDILSKTGKFKNELAAQYFYESCDALEYLHTLPEKVIHRDIKPENILLDKAGHVQLADFGWSNVLENSAFRATFCGTPDYLAPEMIRGEGHNESLDMWEMGVLLYEMVIGKSPFGSSTQEKTCRLILQVDLRFPQGVDPDAKDLIMKLCRKRPEERLTATQAKQHPFVMKYYGLSVTLGDNDDASDRPSVETRWAKRNKEVLEGEMLQILRAKSTTEQKLLSLTEELGEKHKELQKEQTLRKAAEVQFAELKEKEEKQMREREQLLEQMESLEKEIQSKAAAR